VTFATIQSVHSRLDDLPKFGAILVDEAHHIGADNFLRSIASLEAPMLAGVTATPWRGDGYELDELLGSPVFSMGIAEGLQRGFLSEVDYRLLADNLDWESIQRQSRNRYSLSQLNDRLIIPTRDEEAARVIRETFEREQRRSGIVFCRTIDHANYFAGMLRRFEFRAEAISSENPPRERDMLLSHFKAGRYDILTTVDLFNEGVDLPDVDLIVFMRVTHSRRIFVQQLGRGLRLTPTKERVVVLDFVTDLHRVAEVVELDRAVRGGSVEHLGLGERLVLFNNVSAGTYLREWMLDQASVVLREGDPTLHPPEFDFPTPRAPGAI
jgi:superfamily II DNA or RNA helicase